MANGAVDREWLQALTAAQEAGAPSFGVLVSLATPEPRIVGSSALPGSPASAGADGAPKPPNALVAHALSVHRALPGGLRVGGFYVLHSPGEYKHVKRLGVLAADLLTNIAAAAPPASADAAHTQRMLLVRASPSTVSFTTQAFDSNLRPATVSNDKVDTVDIRSHLVPFALSVPLDYCAVPRAASSTTGVAEAIQTVEREVTSKLVSSAMLRVGDRFVDRRFAHKSLGDVLGAPQGKKRAPLVQATLYWTASDGQDDGEARSSTDALSLRVCGHILCVAVLPRSSPSRALLEAFAQDAARSLQSRLELLADEMDALVNAESAPDSFINPFVAGEEMPARPQRWALPRRVVVCSGAAIGVSEYVLPGEPLQEAYEAVCRQFCSGDAPPYKSAAKSFAVCERDLDCGPALELIPRGEDALAAGKADSEPLIAVVGSGADGGDGADCSTEDAGNQRAGMCGPVGVAVAAAGAVVAAAAAWALAS